MCRAINYDKSSCSNYARSDGYTLNFETMFDYFIEVPKALILIKSDIDE